MPDICVPSTEQTTTKQNNNKKEYNCEHLVDKAHHISSTL